MAHTIDPELFARVMQLSNPARREILEILGAHPLSDEELANLIARVGRDERPAPDPKD